METIIKKFKAKVGKWNLSRFDVFGGSISLKYKGNDTFQTKYGCLLTVLIVCIFVPWTSLFCKNYINKTNEPYVAFSHYRTQKNFKANMDTSKFVFSFLFYTMSTSRFITAEELRKSFNIEAGTIKITYSVDKTTYKDNQLKKDVETHKLDIIPCGESQANNETIIENTDALEREIFSKVAVCIDYSSLEQEHHDTQIIKSLYFQISPCTGDHCTNEVPASDLFFNIAFVDPSFNYYDTDKPIRYNINTSNKFVLNNNFTNRAYLFLKKLVIKTKSSEQFNNWTEHVEYAFEKFEKINSDRFAAEANLSLPIPNSNLTTDNLPYFHFQIEPSNLIEEVETDYYTFFQLLGDVGGAQELCGWVIAILYSSYNSFYFDKKLILHGILADCKDYPKRFQISEDYAYIKMCPCSKKKAGDEKLVQDKKVTLKACEMILEERLDVLHFLQDSLEFQLIRRLLLRERHQILVPQLEVTLATKEYNKDLKDSLKKDEDTGGTGFKRKINIIETKGPEFDEVNDDNIDIEKDGIDDGDIDIDEISEQEIADEMAEEKNRVKKGVKDEEIHEEKVQEQKVESEENPDILPVFLKTCRNLKHKQQIIHKTKKPIIKIGPKQAYHQLSQNLHENNLEQIVDKFFLDNLPTDMVEAYHKKSFSEYDVLNPAKKDADSKQKRIIQKKTTEVNNDDDYIKNEDNFNNKVIFENIEEINNESSYIQKELDENCGGKKHCSSEMQVTFIKN